MPLKRVRKQRVDSRSDYNFAYRNSCSDFLSTMADDERTTSTLRDDSVGEGSFETVLAASFETQSLSSSSLPTKQTLLLSDFSDLFRCCQEEEKNIKTNGKRITIEEKQAVDLVSGKNEKPSNGSPHNFNSDDSMFNQDDIIIQQHDILRQIQREQTENQKMKATPRGVKEAPNLASVTHAMNPSTLYPWSSFSPCASAPASSLSPKARPRVKPLESFSSSTGSDCYAPSSRHQKETSEEDYLQMFNDPSAIEEQRRIMERIEAEQRRRCRDVPSMTEENQRDTPSMTEENQRDTPSMPKEAQRSCPTPWTPSLQEDVNVASLETPLDTVQLQRSSSHPRRATIPTYCRETSISPPTLNAMELKAKTIGMLQLKGAPNLSHSEGSTTHLYGRKNLHVRATKKTTDAIAQGNAIIVQCPGCQAVLQVASSAKLLYCTLCSAVSPIELVLSGSHDSAIASAMQDQEVQISSGRNLAKKSPPRC
jgi:hypothetical protein